MSSDNILPRSLLPVRFHQKVLLLHQLYACNAADLIINLNQQIQKTLMELIESNDISAFVEVERAFVLNDMVRFCNNPVMSSSLKSAMRDFHAIKQNLPLVINPPIYKKLLETYFTKQNTRKYGLPYDPARKSFASHIRRLENNFKSYRSESENAILTVRIDAFREAANIYIDLQATSLGYVLDGKNYKPQIPAWGPENQRRAAALERFQSTSAGALLTFAKLGVDAIKQAGSFEQVDWKSVEDQAMEQSLRLHHQDHTQVFEALHNNSPGCVTEEEMFDLIERMTPIVRSLDLEEPLDKNFTADLDT